MKKLGIHSKRSLIKNFLLRNELINASELKINKESKNDDFVEFTKDVNIEIVSSSSNSQTSESLDDISDCD